MNTETLPVDVRALDTLGGSYVDRLAPLLGSVGRRTPTVWRVRGRVPREYRPALREALRRHILEAWHVLDALDGEEAVGPSESPQVRGPY